MPRPVPKAPHPKREAMAALLREGVPVVEIVRQLRCDKTAVFRLKRELGLMEPRSRTPEQKFRTRAVETVDGHMEWTGERNNGTPVIQHDYRYVSARAIAFTIRTGRAPIGNVLPDCDRRDCVAPAHVLDRGERNEIRKQVRDLRGLPEPEPRCSRGHDRETFGRFETSGQAYCVKCNTDRQRGRKS